MLEEVRRIHMLGIGGIGVSAVARILHGRGFEVSGSDVRESSLTEALRAEGVSVVIGHKPENIEGADVVVVSTAIPETNVELIHANETGVPVVHRSTILNELVRMTRTIGVTGTHGKGTVSSMIAWIMENAGWDPGFIIGGMLNNFGVNAKAGSGEWMVVEVDESDGSHHNIDAEYVVCNFLELDHLNYYDDLNHIIGSMKEFLEANPRLRESFINLDCTGNRQLAESLSMRPTGYSLGHNSEFRAELVDEGQFPIRFRVFKRLEDLGEFELNLPGRYNVVNALGALAVTTRIGIDVEVIRKSLATYEGLENRFTILRGGGITVVKDYNSHPTCMRKVLESARDLTKGKIISIFKPYRYTLIKYLQDEYGTAFEGSDEVIISKMYAADEDPIPGVDTELVVEKIRATGLKVTYIEDQTAIPDYLKTIVESGDKVIFFGGDDYFQMADGFVADMAIKAGETEANPVIPRVSGPLTHDRTE